MKNTEIHWLIDPETDVSRLTLEPGNQERLSYVFPSGCGHGWLEVMYLALGMSAFKAVNIFTPAARGRMIPTAEFAADYHEVTFAVRSCPSGRICHRESYPAVELSYGGEQSLVRRAEKIRALPLLDGSCNSEVFGFSIGESLLARLLGEDIADALIYGLGLQTVPSVQVVRIPPTISSVLHDCMPTHLSGSLKKLFTQTKLLEYLCVLADFVTRDRLVADRHRDARDVIRQLHADLLKREGKLPTLDELAGQYGMPARTLNNTFRQEFGLSIFAFIIDYRLSQAHAALTVSRVPIKQLAARLGYVHTQNFVTAFKRKFGYSPGSLRRAGLAMEKNTHGLVEVE